MGQEANSPAIPFWSSSQAHSVAEDSWEDGLLMLLQRPTFAEQAEEELVFNSTIVGCPSLERLKDGHGIQSYLFSLRLV